MVLGVRYGGYSGSMELPEYASSSETAENECYPP